MILNFRKISPEEIEKIKQTPEIIPEIIYPEDAEERKEEYTKQLDIDKAWHGIHYLISESRKKGKYEGGTPLSNVIMGGKGLGPDVGYGPARLISPKDVKKSSDALQKITGEDLQEAFNPEDMKEKEIYPQIWVRDGEEAFQYLLIYFVKVRDFYKDAAESECGILIWLD